MRIGIGLATLALALGPAGAIHAQDQTHTRQMQAGFNICADFVAGRADRAATVATANAAGFSGDDGAAMVWSEGGARVRLSLAAGGHSWCVVSTSDAAADAPALAEQAMGWAARRLPGPWRHARQDQPGATDVSVITGHNGRIGVTASRPNRGGVRVMVIEQAAAQWDASRNTLGASPVTLDLPAYDPPALTATGPSARDLTLGALEQCYAYLAGGERPAPLDASGVRMVVVDRSCMLEVSALPSDPTLMQVALEIVDRRQRSLSRSRRETGFSCIMHRVEVSDRSHQAIAACDRLAPSGQPWLWIQVTSVR